MKETIKSLNIFFEYFWILKEIPFEKKVSNKRLIKIYFEGIKFSIILLFILVLGLEIFLSVVLSTFYLEFKDALSFVGTFGVFIFGYFLFLFNYVKEQYLFLSLFEHKDFKYIYISFDNKIYKIISMNKNIIFMENRSIKFNETKKEKYSLQRQETFNISIKNILEKDFQILPINENLNFNLKRQGV